MRRGSCPPPQPTHMHSPPPPGHGEGLVLQPAAALPARGGPPGGERRTQGRGLQVRGGTPDMGGPRGLPTCSPLTPCPWPGSGRPWVSPSRAAAPACVCVCTHHHCPPTRPPTAAPPPPPAPPPRSTEEIAAFERLASETDVYDRHIFPRIAPQVSSWEQKAHIPSGWNGATSLPAAARASPCEGSRGLECRPGRQGSLPERGSARLEPSPLAEPLPHPKICSPSLAARPPSSPFPPDLWQRRHQAGDRVPPVWRQPQGDARRHQPPRRHQRAAAGRPLDRQVAVPQVCGQGGLF